MFSLNDLFLANIPKKVEIQLVDIISILDTLIINGNSVYYKIKQSYLKNLPIKTTFSDYLSIIKEKYTETDNIYIYAFYACIGEIYTEKLAYVWNIPGYNEDFHTIKDKNDLTLFCYNEEVDFYEVVNLLDPKNYSSFNDPIFIELNKALNESIVENKMNPMVFLIPYPEIFNAYINLIDSIDNNLININQDFLNKSQFIFNYTANEQFSLAYNPTSNTNSFKNYNFNNYW
jgi:hypothetical protein